MTLTTVVQRACHSPATPDNERIQYWADAAYRAGCPSDRDLALTVRVVDEEEAGALNLRYRSRDYAPNVLSFPMGDGSPETGILGDVVICAPVVEREAAEQHKPLEAHWAHLVVHGVLHCLDFEHDTEAGAVCMEGMETGILAEFGFPDPYTVHDEQ